VDLDFSAIFTWSQNLDEPVALTESLCQTTPPNITTDKNTYNPHDLVFIDIDAECKNLSGNTIERISYVTGPSNAKTAEEHSQYLDRQAMESSIDSGIFQDVFCATDTIFDGGNARAFIPRLSTADYSILQQPVNDERSIKFANSVHSTSTPYSDQRFILEILVKNTDPEISSHDDQSGYYPITSLKDNKIKLFNCGRLVEVEISLPTFGASPEFRMIDGVGHTVFTSNPFPAMKLTGLDGGAIFAEYTFSHSVTVERWDDSGYYGEYVTEIVDGEPITIRTSTNIIKTPNLPTSHIDSSDGKTLSVNTGVVPVTGMITVSLSDPSLDVPWWQEILSQTAGIVFDKIISEAPYIGKVYTGLNIYIQQTGNGEWTTSGSALADDLGGEPDFIKLVIFTDSEQIPKTLLLNKVEDGEYEGRDIPISTITQEFDDEIYFYYNFGELKVKVDVVTTYP